MDYFNQYTYAEVTANMISEIAYTETLSFWSTLISAPLVFLGSWSIKGTEKMIGKASEMSVKTFLALSIVKIALAPEIYCPCQCHRTTDERSGHNANATVHPVSHIPLDHAFLPESETA